MNRPGSVLGAFLRVAIPQSGLLLHVRSLRLPSGRSGLVLTLSSAAGASLPQPLASGGCGCLGCFSTGSYRWARNLCVLIIYFSSWLYCSLRFQGSPQTCQWECFLVFGNFSLFKDSLPETDLQPYLFCLSFYLLYFFLSPKTMGCFSGCLMSSASIRKLFCGIYSAFKCSFDDLCGRKWSPHPILPPS